jgi:hypothetical protein
MSSLLFHDLPPGAVPLYIGEAAEGVAETGLLVLDHVGQEVRFVKSDPFGSFEVPAHSTRRYSRWEIDAMMPRWQLRELYGEARPLLERIQLGTTMTRLPTHWDRDQTPEAQAASVLVDDLTAQPVEAPVEWVPGLRPVREETALERAIRLTDIAVATEFIHQFHQKELAGVPIENYERNLRNVLAHGKHAFYPHPDRTLGMSGSPILSAAPGSGKSYGLIGLLNNMGPVSNELGFLSTATGSPSQQPMDSRTKKGRYLPVRPKYSRKGINGQWGALIEESDVRQIAG